MCGDDIDGLHIPEILIIAQKSVNPNVQLKNLTCKLEKKNYMDHKHASSHNKSGIVRVNMYGGKMKEKGEHKSFRLHIGHVPVLQQYDINYSLIVAEYILLLQLHPISSLGTLNYLCMYILCWSLFFSRHT